MPNIQSFSHGLPVAAGAVTMGILDALVSKEVLSRAEARAILTNAIAGMERSRVNAAVEAVKLIRENWLPRFPE